MIPTLRNNVNNNNYNNTSKNNKTEKLQNSNEENNDSKEGDGFKESGGLNEDNIEQESYDPIDGTEEMTEREVREAALMNDYLGKQIVIELTYSQNIFPISIFFKIKGHQIVQ